MIRHVIAWIVAGAVILFILTRLAAALDKSDELELRVDSLLVDVALGDQARAAGDEARRVVEVRIEGLNAANAALRADLRSARGRTLVASRSADSARATVQLDTLTPALRGLILVERGLATSFRDERDLLQGLLDTALVRIRLDSTELARVQLDLLTLVGQRDEALDLVAGYQAQVHLNLWRWIGRELPTFAACAAGGAIASVVANGDALVGGVIGLGSCVVIRAVF